MNDAQLLLASAYVDDDVDDAARAQAEADAEVMAEVTRLRALRAELRDVGAPDPDRREQALAAALAAFADDQPAPVRVPSAPVPLPRRQQRAWWGGALAAAAAALIVVVAGVVVLRGAGGGRDDDSASIATQAQLSPAAADTGEGDESEGETPQANQEDAGGAAPAATAAAAADDTTVAAGSLTAAELSAREPALATPEELAAYARQAAGDAADEIVVASCTVAGTFIGRATYDGQPVEVFVVDDVATAVDAANCVVVERVGL